MSKFDVDQFLEWLADQDGPIPARTLRIQWPQFPRERLQYVTGPFVAGKPAYYKRDLRRAARGKRVID